MKFEEQQKAIKMRRKGLSLKEIARSLGVAKASVSVWVRDVVLSDKTKQDLRMKGSSRDVIEKRRDIRLLREKEKVDILKTEAKKDFDHITQRELKIIGCMLYLAEGGKTKKGMARISNSDLEVIKIMLRFFKEICLVPDEKFKGHIHTHSENNAKKCENYWSDLTGIPKTQFFKTYVKLSKAGSGNRGTLPYGTFDLYVCDTKIFLKIMAWIEKICFLVNNKA
ncbi:MAG: hypothetical protein V4469_02655 [Patescibacteria group bacterium]